MPDTSVWHCASLLPAAACVFGGEAEGEAEGGEDGHTNPMPAWMLAFAWVLGRLRGGYRAPHRQATRKFANVSRLSAKRGVGSAVPVGPHAAHAALPQCSKT